MIAPTPAPAPILLGLALDAFALERLRDGRADRIRAAVDRDRSNATVRLPLRSMRPAWFTELTTPRIDRAGGHQHAVALVAEIDHRRRLEAILDLRRLRAERVLQPDVELGADRNLVRDSATDRPVAGARLAVGRVGIGRGRRRSPQRPSLSPRARLRMFSMRSRTSAYSRRAIGSFLRSLTFR